MTFLLAGYMALKSPVAIDRYMLKLKLNRIREHFLKALNRSAHFHTQSLSSLYQSSLNATHLLGD